MPESSSDPEVVAEFTELGARIQKRSDGSARVRTSDGLTMVFAPNPSGDGDE